jgi:hypothetical protein
MESGGEEEKGLYSFDQLLEDIGLGKYHVRFYLCMW